MGVKLSEDLTWNCHIEYSLKTATSRLCTLRQLRKSDLNKQDLVLVYCSFMVRFNCYPYKLNWVSSEAGFTDYILPSVSWRLSFSCIQWRKFTFSGGGAKPSKFPTKLSNFRQPPPPPFALEKAVFSPLIGQNFRKFVIFPHYISDHVTRNKPIRWI